MMETYIFWLSDFQSFVRRKINEYLKNKTYRSDGSPTIRGWTVIPKIHRNQLKELFDSKIINIDYDKSFKDNYDSNKLIIRSWVNKNIEQ